MDQNIIFFILIVFFLLIFGRILILPLKIIFKILLNSALGALLLYIINYIGKLFFGFGVGINIWTSLIVGLLGIPGAVLLILVKIFII